MSGAGAGLSEADRKNGVIALAAVQAAGFPDTRTALQVAYAESSWRQSLTNKNTNGSVDYGLFQINTVHKPTEAVKSDPFANAVFAKRLYDGKENGSKGWTSWVAYTTGRYKKGEPVSATNALLNYASTPDGKKAVEDAAKNKPIALSEPPLSGGLDGIKDGLAAANPLNVLDNVKAAVLAAIDTVVSLANMFLMVLVGLVFIALGIYMAYHREINSAAGKAVSGLAGMVPVGKVAKTVKAAGAIKAAT